MPEPITRRRFLGVGAAAGLTVAASAGVMGGVARALGAPADVSRQGPRLPGPPFTLGVASGDPLHDRVVLWTRLAPDLLVPDGGMGTAPVPVRWEVANDERFANVVASGRETATPDDAFSVHADATGLAPDREYFYRFRAGGEVSPVGRTRTAPRPGAQPNRLRFAFSSCQNYQDGFFGAYRHLADEDVAFVAFLGDYIYESGMRSDRPRQHNSGEVMDLAAYRARYAQYKSDPDLQAAHERAPWIVTWDDHEVENNYAADFAQNDTVSAEEFARRRADAYKAWWEHQPVRRPAPTGPDYRIYRSLSFGRLLDLHVLDTRQYRTNQPCGSPIDIGFECTDADLQERTLLGKRQRAWLGRGLCRSDARWGLIGQQVMVGRMNFTPQLDPSVFNFDQWDGYTADRTRLLEQVAASRANTIVITGDIHSSWVNDLTAVAGDAASDTVATELVGPSITSRFEVTGLVQPAIPANPTVKYFDGERHGYVVCDVSADEWRTDYRYVSTVDTPDATIETGASFVVDHRRPGATPD